jgi:hypothetical protein
MNRWRVDKRNGRWRVLTGDAWVDAYDTLPEAHDAATEQAAMDAVCAPGGLWKLEELRRIQAMKELRRIQAMNWRPERYQTRQRFVTEWKVVE